MQTNEIPAYVQYVVAVFVDMATRFFRDCAKHIGIEHFRRQKIRYESARIFHRNRGKIVFAESRKHGCVLVLRDEQRTGERCYLLDYRENIIVQRAIVHAVNAPIGKRAESIVFGQAKHAIFREMFLFHKPSTNARKFGYVLSYLQQL